MNINHSQFIFIIYLLTVFVGSCTQKDFKSAETGYQYKIVKKGGGPVFKNNHYILMNMDYYYENDSLLFTSTEKNMPVTMHYIDTIWERSGQIYHGLKKLKVGDSAIFRVNCSDLFEISFRGNIPYGLSPNGEITLHVGIINMLTPGEFRMWQANLFKERQDRINEKIEEQLFEDITLIDNYLEESGIIPMELESGIRYVIQDPGNGDQPERGDRVVVHYTGYLLDGTQFNSSYDIQEPYEFILGAGNVIKAWDEGLALMSEGAKYTFYVPSTLAYGANELGKLVGPNTVVVFDLELLEIKKMRK
jgi:FKBP-type peptidyl-prolyl cis-trans isomerase